MQKHYRVLIFGYGSIGSRHAFLASQAGCGVHVISRNEQCLFPRSESLHDVPSGGYDLAIIATPTSEHGDTLTALLATGFSGRILVEKPLAHTPGAIPPDVPSERVFIAYNLRFHPLMQRIQTLLAGRRLLGIQAHVGQYLPSWRPQRDYRLGYSPYKEQGGGVLRDLSHELDLVQHIAGPWRQVTALGGKYSALAGNSEDIFSLLLECADCPCVSVQMDYLDRGSHRHLLVNAEGLTLMVDFIANTLCLNAEHPEIHSCDRNFTYTAQLDAVLTGESEYLCSFIEGVRTVNLIHAAEQASREKIWISA